MLRECDSGLKVSGFGILDRSEDNSPALFHCPSPTITNDSKLKINALPCPLYDCKEPRPFEELHHWALNLLHVLSHGCRCKLSNTSHSKRSKNCSLHAVYVHAADISALGNNVGNNLGFEFV
jgi:hypothetical protein